MSVVNCIICSKGFYIKPNRVSKGWGKYCSNNCKHIGFRNGNIYNCKSCSKRIYKSKSVQQRSTSGNYFCNKSCQTKWRNSIFAGENHANWKGGEHSYREAMRRTNINPSCSKCRLVDARVLAVHHKDKNRKNNALSNLMWLCHNCHFLVHHYNNEAKGFLVPVA